MFICFLSLILAYCTYTRHTHSHIRAQSSIFPTLYWRSSLSQFLFTIFSRFHIIYALAVIFIVSTMMCLHFVVYFYQLIATI